MKKIDEIIQEHYIHEDYELEKFIESFYENKEDVEKLKSVFKNRRINEDQKITNKIDRVVHMILKMDRLLLMTENTNSH